MIHIYIDIMAEIFYCFELDCNSNKKVMVFKVKMHFVPAILLAIISPFVEDVICVTYQGKLSSFADIMQRLIDIGDGKYPRPIPGPDLTTGRRTFANIVILLLSNHKIPRSDNNQKVKRELYKKAVRKFNLKEDKKAELVETQHKRKVKEIVEFLNEYYLTTNYLYDEVQRIKRQRKVKDDLRRMVEYLEKPEKAKMKAEVLECYYDKRRNEVLTVDSIDKHMTNNLVINVLKDPYNDAFVN